MTTASDPGREPREHEQRSAPTGPVPDAPRPLTLTQIAAVPSDARRQLNVAVPDELRLHRRMALYREDHGLDASRQNIAAAAIDEWLRARGY